MTAPGGALRLGVLIVALVALTAGAGLQPGSSVVAARAAISTEPTSIGFTVCPNVTTVSFRYPPDGPSNHGCNLEVSSSSNSSATNPADLGTLCTSQNPIGAWVAVQAPQSGIVVPNADFTATIDRTTVKENDGPGGVVELPVGSFSAGAYSVVASFPGKSVTQPTGNTVVYGASSAYGALHVVIGNAGSGSCQESRKLPPGTPPAGSATGTVLVNGAPFAGGTIQYGSSVDVTSGRLDMATENGPLTTFGSGGIPSKFKLARAKAKKLTIVELRLLGGNFSVCGGRALSDSAKKKKKIRLLWAKGKGHFRTKGRFSIASVHGTFWLTEDSCTGSLTSVREGVVSVYDQVKKKTIQVRAGRQYWARPRK